MVSPVLIVVSGLSQGAIYALVALGLTIIYRSTTVVNFAHGAIFMLSALVAAVLIQSGTPYLLAVAAGLAVAVVVGVLIQTVVMNRILTQDHMTLVFATVAISFIIRGAATLYSVEIRGMPAVFGNTQMDIGGAVVSPQYVLTSAALVVVAAGFGYVLVGTKAGSLIRASTQSLRGAALVGIDVRRVFATTWAIGAGLAGLAGVLAAPTLLVGPSMGDRPLILGFAAMALGGFGSLLGAILAGLILGVLEQIANFYISTSLGDMIGFLVIAVVLVVRPSGLFGTLE